MEGLGGNPVLAPERLDRPYADPLVGRLFPPLATGVHWGLERIEQALAVLGDPHRAYATVHIGGTNGKGSVTSTIASVLRRAGHRTGCYTSPHLCSFRERMLVDGEPLAEADLLRFAAEVREPVVRFGLTFFEAVTVLAMHAFSREGIEIGVVEVGLGGRLDATNVLQPEVSAVTNIALDHADYLGETLAEIAREKAGIVKPGVPFVTAEADPAILELLVKLAREAGAPATRVRPESVRAVCVSRSSTKFEMTTRGWGDLVIRTPLLGRHQATNAALAIEVLYNLSDTFRPSANEIVEGIAAVAYHGRDEIVVIDGRTWLFDVAHNTAGIQSLVDTIDRLDVRRPLVALVGVLGDKDWGSMLPPLLSRADAAILTQPPSAPRERRWDPASAADRVQAITDVRVVEDFAQAAATASERAGEGTVVVTGSVHTVGSAMKLLGIDPLGGGFGHLEFVALDIALTVAIDPGHLRRDVEKTLVEVFGNGDLPDGGRGYFHPGEFFGPRLELSAIVARAMDVPGVLRVTPRRFQRWGEQAYGELQQGHMDIGPLEIARLDGDPSQPENGTIVFHMEGGG